MLKDIEKYIYTNRFNHIYLYGLINNESVLDISARINHFNKTEQNNGVYIKPKAIVLHINSPGGHLISGIALMNIIHNSRVPIIVYAEGMVASAATFVLVVAKYRLCAPESIILIHQLSASIGGKHEEIKFQAKISNEFMKILKKLYIKYTKISKNKISELLRHDIFFTANECLKYGIIDKVLEKTPEIIYRNYFKKNPEYILPSNILKIKTNFNNLYFYGIDCDKKNCEKEEEIYDLRKTSGLQYILSFYNNNRNKNNTNTNIILGNGSPKPILIHINEHERLYNISDILPLINTILLSRLPIYSFINSPTTEKTILYTMLCYKRYIYKNASVIINFMDINENSDKHDNVVKNTELTRKFIINILKKYTKLPDNIMKNLFKERFYFTSEQCIKYKICDEITN
jgi:ATP-dependent Clp endopeptidase proteolytic subunit ClpP